MYRISLVLIPLLIMASCSIDSPKCTNDDTLKLVNAGYTKAEISDICDTGQVAYEEPGISHSTSMNTNTAPGYLIDHSVEECEGQYFNVNRGESKCGFGLSKDGALSFNGRKSTDPLVIPDLPAEKNRATAIRVFSNASPSGRYHIVWATHTEPDSKYWSGFAQYIFDSEALSLTKVSFGEPPAERWYWSPDESHLVFFYADEGWYYFQAIKMPGTGSVRITFSQGSQQLVPIWDRDGPIVNWIDNRTFETRMGVCRDQQCEDLYNSHLVPFRISPHAITLVDETTGDLSQKNVWNFQDMEWRDIHMKCEGGGGFDAWHSSAAKLGIRKKRSTDAFINCVTNSMQKAGASPQAVAFTKQMKGKVYMGSFREMGKVDLATTVAPLWNTPMVEDYILVNGSPRIVELWENIKNINITLDRLYPFLKSKFPNISMSPETSYVSMQQLPQNGQRFIFSFSLYECRACARPASVEIAFDFDEAGKLLGSKFLKIVLADDIDVLVECADLYITMGGWEFRQKNSMPSCPFTDVSDYLRECATLPGKGKAKQKVLLFRGVRSMHQVAVINADEPVIITKSSLRIVPCPLRVKKSKTGYFEQPSRSREPEYQQSSIKIIPGEVIYFIKYIGEGTNRYWREGKLVTADAVLSDDYNPWVEEILPCGRDNHYWQPTQEHWFHVQTLDGMKEGWTNELDLFKISFEGDCS